MSDLWADLDAESRKPGPTMTITKAQYGALRDAARLSHDRGADAETMAGAMTFGPGCGPFDHPVGCQCPYPLVAAERDRIAVLSHDRGADGEDAREPMMEAGFTVVRWAEAGPMGCRWCGFGEHDPECIIGHLLTALTTFPQPALSVPAPTREAEHAQSGLRVEKLSVPAPTLPALDLLRDTLDLLERGRVFDARAQLREALRDA